MLIFFISTTNANDIMYFYYFTIQINVRPVKKRIHNGNNFKYIYMNRLIIKHYLLASVQGGTKNCITDQYSSQISPLNLGSDRIKEQISHCPLFYCYLPSLFLPTFIKK